MQINSPILFLEINKFEYIFSVGEYTESNKFKLLHTIKILNNDIRENQIIDYDLMYNILKKNIFYVEQKFNIVLKDVILIIDNFNCNLINFSGYKKLNGSQLSKENITYILNSLKTKINEIEDQKTILHIFNSKYMLDKKKTENLPIGLFGNFYSQELSFFLISNYDYKNINYVFEKCNLRIKKIISKSFIDGVYLINSNLNLDTFFKIEINEEKSKIIYFENSALRYIQNFEFGSNIVIQDISKIIGLKKDIIKNILSNSIFSKDSLEEEYVDEKLIDKLNSRKIKKKLIFDIANARIEEMSDLILLKNINIISFLRKKNPIFLRICDESTFFPIQKSFENYFSKNSELELKILKNKIFESYLEDVIKLVQFGWKKEAVPIIQEKKSIITRFFEVIFK